MIESRRVLTMSDGTKIIITVGAGEMAAIIETWGADLLFRVTAKDLKILASALYDVRNDVQMNDPEHKDEF